MLRLRADLSQASRRIGGRIEGLRVFGGGQLMDLLSWVNDGLIYIASIIECLVPIILIGSEG
jgi:hypothetical protein